MQYRDYYISLVDYGYIIQDGHDNFVMLCDTEQEAIEAIDSMLDNDEHGLDKQPVDCNFMRLFDKYCRKLPNKCYIEDKTTTTNEKALLRFIRSFEKNFKVKVLYTHKIIENQYYYMITSIESNQ